VPQRKSNGNQLSCRSLRSIPPLAPMPHRKDRDERAIVAIQHDIPAVAEWDLPLAKLRRPILDRPAGFGMGGKGFHALANGAGGPAGGITVPGSKEGMQAFYVAQGGRRPDQLRHGSTVRLWGRSVRACF
jgi:hypothetical protein